MTSQLADLPLSRSHRPQAPLAVGVLILCCVLWGYSFPAMQVATTSIDRVLAPGHNHRLASRALFNALRFGMAAALYAVLTARRQRNFSRADVQGGAAVGAFFTGGMFLQVLGLRWTLPSVSSFLTSLAVVFAPVAQALVLRRRVGGPTWIAVALALAGVALLSMPNPDAAAPQTLAARPPVPLLGEMLTALAAMIFTAQILCLDRVGPRADVARLTLIMLATTSILSLVIGLSISPGFIARIDLAALSGDGRFLLTLGLLVVFSSVVALHLMNGFQPRVSPATASVVYCTEPIFGTLFSIALGTEKWSWLTLYGGVIVLAGVLVVARSERRKANATG